MLSDSAEYLQSRVRYILHELFIVLKPLILRYTFDTHIRRPVGASIVPLCGVGTGHQLGNLAVSPSLS